MGHNQGELRLPVGVGVRIRPAGSVGKGLEPPHYPQSGQEMPLCLSFPLTHQWGLRERRPGAATWL